MAKSSFTANLFGSFTKKVKRLRYEADAARDKGDWQAAKDGYQRYLALVPNDFPIIVQYGHSLKELGFLAEAEAAYLRARAIIPTDPDLNLQIGHLMKVCGRLPLAYRYYKIASELDPHLEDARQEMDRLQNFDEDNMARRAADNERRILRSIVEEWGRAMVRLEQTVRATAARGSAVEQELRAKSDAQELTLQGLRIDIDNIASTQSATPHTYSEDTTEKFMAMQQAIDEIRRALVAGLATTRTDLVDAMDHRVELTIQKVSGKPRSRT
jgi:tetratricopeptide (TPR) repeat protein